MSNYVSPASDQSVSRSVVVSELQSVSRNKHLAKIVNPFHTAGECEEVSEEVRQQVVVDMLRSFLPLPLHDLQYASGRLYSDNRLLLSEMEAAPPIRAPALEVLIYGLLGKNSIRF